MGGDLRTELMNCHLWHLLGQNVPGYEAGYADLRTVDNKHRNLRRSIRARIMTQSKVREIMAAKRTLMIWYWQTTNGVLVSTAVAVIPRIIELRNRRRLIMNSEAG
jgi:hypothetical protein